MANRKRNIYWLLFLALLLGGSMLLSVGQTFAKYSNTQVLNTVLPMVNSESASDCLVSRGSQTILLGTISGDSPTEASFTVSSGKAMSATLCANVDKEDYLQASFRMDSAVGQVTLTDGLLEMGENAKAELTLVLTPLPDVRLSEEQVSISVTLGDILSGTFLATLPEPPSSEPPSSEPPSSEPPAEPESPAVDITEPGLETDSPEQAEAETGSSAGEGENPPETEQTEPLSEEAALESVYFGNGTIKTVSVFEPDGILPVVIVPDGEADRVVLGIGGETEAVMSGFPARTRYSLDSGESYYLLYNGGTIDLLAESGGEISLLLDFSGCTPSESQTITLVGEEYSQTQLTGRFSGDTAALGEEITLPEAVLLTAEKSSESLTIPKVGDDWTSVITVEMLGTDENGAVCYKPLTLEDSSITAQITPGEQENTLNLSIGDKKPAAGTYRVTIEWTFEGVCFKKISTTLFIVYSG